ncbi:MAG: PEP-CTERM sorting domain-containing protein [Planctomycetota bacterium]
MKRLILCLMVMLLAAPAWAVYEDFNYGTGVWPATSCSRLEDKPAPSFTRLIDSVPDKDGRYLQDSAALGSFPLSPASEDGWVGAPKNTTSGGVVYYRWDAGAFQAVEGEQYVVESKVMGVTWQPYSDTWNAGFHGELYITQIPETGGDAWANYNKDAGMSNCNSNWGKIDILVNNTAYPHDFKPGGVVTPMAQKIWYEFKIVLDSVPGAGNDTSTMYAKRTGVDPDWVLVSGPNLLPDLDTTAANNVPVIGMYQWYTTGTHGYNHAYGVVDHLSQIPEPATVALLGLGAVALLRRRK